MQSTLQKSGEFDIQSELIKQVRSLKYEFDEEALYFLNLVLEYNALKDEYGGRRRRFLIYNRTGKFRIAKARTGLIKRLNSSISVFAETLVANSDDGLITSKSLYVTMKGICPLWPFC